MVEVTDQFTGNGEVMLLTYSVCRSEVNKL